jgi:hypothetical protein
VDHLDGTCGGHRALACVAGGQSAERGDTFGDRERETWTESFAAAHERVPNGIRNDRNRRSIAEHAREGVLDL